MLYFTWRCASSLAALFESNQLMKTRYFHTDVTLFYHQFQYVDQSHQELSLILRHIPIYDGPNIVLSSLSYLGEIFTCHPCSKFMRTDISRSFLWFLKLLCTEILAFCEIATAYMRCVKLSAGCVPKMITQGHNDKCVNASLIFMETLQQGWWNGEQHRH